jgi:hypothetical protein
MCIRPNEVKQLCIELVKLLEDAQTVTKSFEEGLDLSDEYVLLQYERVGKQLLTLHNAITGGIAFEWIEGGLKYVVDQTAVNHSFNI